MRQPIPPSRNRYDNRDDWDTAWSDYVHREDDYEEWAEWELDRQRDEAMEEWEDE